MATQQFLFEVAWEVCNKVGGIYTVIRSKIPVTIEEYGTDRFCLLGPYFPANADAEFDRTEPPALLKTTLANLESKYGIVAHFGKWLVLGYPRAILFEMRPPANGCWTLNDCRHQLFMQYGLGIPDSDVETHASIIFGYQVYSFFRELLATSFAKEYKTIVHFHEWQASIGLLYMAKSAPPMPAATLFTTHATLLGRYLCATGGTDFYNRLPSVNPDKEAGDRGIYHRHKIEHLSAHVANVFTTVSDITAFEAEQLLKRLPDRVTPNGLRLENTVALHEFQNLHKVYKDRITDFVRGHFHGYLDFDLDSTLYFFTAGRYEYVNKGVDMYIDALAELNQKLKEEKSSATIIAFIIMPARTNNFNVETLRGQSLIKKVRESTDQVTLEIDKRIFEFITRGQLPDVTKLITEEEMIMLKRRLLSLKRNTLPPIVTHNMIDDQTDPILGHLRRVGLFNNPEDRVKIVFHPEFINSNNPLIGLDYDQFVRGCHLGVFPSYYEPWGYTPAECTIMGVPSVSSNLTGFANYMQKKIGVACEEAGIYVVDRRFRNYRESVEQLSSIMQRFTKLNRRQRIEMRNRCERLSEVLDWASLGQEYKLARQKAVDRAFPPASVQPSP